MVRMRNYWDKVAEKGLYQMGPAPHRIAILKKLAHLQCHSFLDIGCGTGPLYQLLMDAPLGEYLPLSEYKGVDYSENMIERAKERFPEGDFELQDARILKEDTKSWDGVVLMHCLDHLDDYKRAISEAARVSKKYVIIVLWRPLVKGEANNLNSHNALEREEGTGEWEDTHLQEYTHDNLIDAFQEAKLHLLTEEELPLAANRMFVLEKYE